MRFATWLLYIFLILFLIVLLNGMIKGVGPTVGADGWLKWDYTGFISKQENETERERIKQQAETARNEDDAQALQTIAIAVAIAGSVIVWIVQSNRTQRKAIDAMIGVPQYQAPGMLPGPAAAQQLPPVVNLYINYLIPGGQGQVIDVGGVPMIRDDSRQMLIPLDVAERELATLGLLPPPPSRRLPGPTIDGA